MVAPAPGVCEREGVCPRMHVVELRSAFGGEREGARKGKDRKRAKRMRSQDGDEEEKEE